MCPLSLPPFGVAVPEPNIMGYFIVFFVAAFSANVFRRACLGCVALTIFADVAALRHGSGRATVVLSMVKLMSCGDFFNFTAASERQGGLGNCTQAAVRISAVRRAYDWHCAVATALQFDTDGRCFLCRFLGASGAVACKQGCSTARLSGLRPRSMWFWGLLRRALYCG